MKIFIYTARFGVETTLTYHCEDAEFFPNTQLVVMGNEVDTTIDFSKEGIARIADTLIFLGESDILTVAHCDAGCKHGHPRNEMTLAYR